MLEYFLSASREQNSAQNATIRKLHHHYNHLLISTIALTCQNHVRSLQNSKRNRKNCSLSRCPAASRIHECTKHWCLCAGGWPSVPRFYHSNSIDSLPSRELESGLMDLELAPIEVVHSWRFEKLLHRTVLLQELMIFCEGL